MPKIALCLAVILAAASAPANACDCVSLIPGSPRFEADLDRIVAYYPVVAEGVIEQDGAYAWRFRPTREYRGPRQPFYRIGLGSDCSIAPNEMNAMLGKPVFLLLSGGPEHYEAGRCGNLAGSDATAVIRARYAESCKPR